MLVTQLNKFKGGWYIGDFEPSIIKTKKFEACVKYHKKHETWKRHYQKKATEYNVLVEGKMVLDDNVKYTVVEKGDIFVIYPFESVKPTFLTDCTVFCIKVPSVKDDKVVDE